ncbi:hypothetical protein [Domibacillus epiphyticus]|uniref:Stage VI sporulation protein D N-terminal domain-containing protein n=1 Tax=Domibacillus epiphyticus TaxID=1714355 RepID=A0A1V2A959_9BACI|nr:hypothetical protein [Domibacillus epiphyticus]OMP67539.1 hypothetical protein BTO28_06220 [Domibacillus epiphyticus]
MDDLFFVSIQEDVVFPDGENVEELLSISLDPQVIIEPRKEGTTLTGTIEVTGEYLIDTEEEENIRQFFRHIPVHAFIPPHRQAASDSDIQIHSFDYDVQKPGRLMLTAELAVALVGYQETPVVPQANFNDELPVMEEAALETKSYDEHDKHVVIEEEGLEALSDESPVVEEEASVLVQKGNTEESSIFSWLGERSDQQAQWRFSIEKSGDVELISTQGEAQPPEE